MVVCASLATIPLFIADADEQSFTHRGRTACHVGFRSLGKTDSPTTEREPSPSFSSSLIIYHHSGLLLLAFALQPQLARSAQNISSHRFNMSLQQQATPESVATLPLHNLNPPHLNRRPFRFWRRILGKDRPWVSWRDTARAILFVSCKLLTFSILIPHFASVSLAARGAHM